MPTSSRRRRPPIAILIAIALLAVGATAGLALAKSFTLKVTKNVHVTNQKAEVKPFAVKPVNTHEAVAVGPTGFAVYTFQGETTHHIICKKKNSQATNCWAFWPPVSVSSAKGISKASGIKGKLGTFRNHGTRQLTLNGQPLYYFTPDISSHNRKQAMGDELKTFGSIWHIVKAGATKSQTAGPKTPAPKTTTTTSMPPYTYQY
jgi:predicted lipoprotein with Yx(FWY)xxD motif